MNIDSYSSGQNFALHDAANSNIDKNVAKLDLATKDLSVLAETQDSGTRSSDKAEQNVSPEQIDTAVSEISEFVQANSRQLNFSVDADSQKQIVKVTDANSGEVIRQIPSEEILKLSERLKDLHTEVGTAVGVLFNKQV